MNKQVIIAVVLAGVAAAVFTPILLRDGEEGEAPVPAAEQAGSVAQEAAETAEAAEQSADQRETAPDSGSASSPEPAVQSQRAEPATSSAPADQQAADAAVPESEPEAESAAVPQTLASSGEATAAASDGDAPATAEQAAAAPTTEAPATTAPAAEAEPLGEVAAQIRIADVPTLTESDEPSPASEAGDNQPSDIAVSVAPEAVPLLEQGSAEGLPTEESSLDSSGSTPLTAESPTLAAEGEASAATAGVQATGTQTAAPEPAAEEAGREIASAETAGSAASTSESAGSGGAAQSDITVVSRSEPAPQVAALPDQPEGIELPPVRKPSFDVVRVEPTGEAVIAGRAEPGSQVVLTDDDEPIASVPADSAGDWVIILDQPLESGSHELGLTAETPGGETVESENVVIVAVPEPPSQVAAAQAEPESSTAGAAGSSDVKAPVSEPLAVLASREGQGPSVVLQQPDPKGIADRELVLSAIDYDAAGRIIVSGKAPPGARVVVYLDDRAIGQVVADETGAWVLKPDTALAVGLHRLRLDQLDAAGQVVARIESPFSRAQALLDLPGERFVVVQPGNSLWFIARQTYGEGLRYTLIFDSNSGQIRDPDLIYPGQIFLLPELN